MREEGPDLQLLLQHGMDCSLPSGGPAGIAGCVTANNLHIMGDCVDPCKPEACAIQDCLKKNGYNESKCTAHIDRLYACCKQFYKREGTEARSPCCPTPKLLKFKMEQREQEKLDAKLL